VVLIWAGKVDPAYWVLYIEHRVAVVQVLGQLVPGIEGTEGWGLASSRCGRYLPHLAMYVREYLPHPNYY